MKALRLRLLCFPALVLGMTGSAQEKPADTHLTLPAAVDLAVRDNLDLQSLRVKWEAMLERPAQAHALPNPMLKYGAMDAAREGTWPDTNEKRIMLEQQFPWFGKRGLREGIARKDAERRVVEAEGIARATQIIQQRLTPLYVQHEAIEAQKAMVGSPNHSVIYIPVGPMGVPIVSTLGPPGEKR